MPFVGVSVGGRAPGRHLPDHRVGRDVLDAGGRRPTDAERRVLFASRLVRVIGHDGMTDNGGVNRQFDSRYVFSDGTLDPQSVYGARAVGPDGDEPHQVGRRFPGVAKPTSCSANIDRIPAGKIDPTRKARYIAEAKFLRAVLYLQLVATFGPVPMPLVPMTDAEARELTNATVTTALRPDHQGSRRGRGGAPRLVHRRRHRPRDEVGGGLVQGARGAVRRPVPGRRRRGKAGDRRERVRAQCELRESVPLRRRDQQRSASSRATTRSRRRRRGRTTTSSASTRRSTNSGTASVVPIRQLVDSYLMKDGLPITTSPLYDREGVDAGGHAVVHVEP